MDKPSPTQAPILAIWRHPNELPKLIPHNSASLAWAAGRNHLAACPGEWAWVWSGHLWQEVGR